jgi:hypothetical protein
VTNDTAAIQAACNYLMSIGGGTLYFPDGVYSVEFDVTNEQYYYLFKFASNTRVVMSEGANIKVNGAKPQLYSSVFGIDKTKLPAKNIHFQNVNIEGIALGSIDYVNPNNPVGISFSLPLDYPIHSIQNVTFENCRLTNLDYGIYMTHGATVGTIERVTKNVKIKGCTGVGCVGGFLTVDVEDCIIEGNTADGGNPSYAYDAVSCHAGINIQIIGNHFYNYGTGQVINITNSTNNKCGTKNVLIANNIIRDCPTTAIQLSINNNETVYGLDNVMVSGNKLTNVRTGIIVTPGNGTPGTPFKNFKIIGNQIYATDTGLQINGNAGFTIDKIGIQNNRVVVTSTTTGYGVFLQYVNYSFFIGNDIESTANQAGHNTLKVGNLYYCQLTSNKVWAANPSNGTPTTIDTVQESNFSSNYLYGSYAFTNIVNCLLKSNLFESTGTHEGRNLGDGWEQNHSGNVIIYQGAAPTTYTWKKGDKVINNTPAAGGYSEFVCITDGTASSTTWKGSGLIQA